MGIQLFHWNVDKFQNVKILSLLRFSKEESIFRDKSVCVCVCVCVCACTRARTLEKESLGGEERLRKDFENYSRALGDLQQKGTA